MGNNIGHNVPNKDQTPWNKTRNIGKQQRELIPYSLLLASL